MKLQSNAVPNLNVIVSEFEQFKKSRQRSDEEIESRIKKYEAFNAYLSGKIDINPYREPAPKAKGLIIDMRPQMIAIAR